MVTAIHVSNSILEKAFAEDIDITPMKLQKIIYFVYRDYLQKTGKSLFSERFETWKYGPVLATVYNEFKRYKSNAIRKYATESDGKTVCTVDESTSPIFKVVINDVWKKCKNFDGIYLSSVTHKKGSAWYNAYKARRPYLSIEDIKQEDIAIE